jgi:hypothetical protein
MKDADCGCEMSAAKIKEKYRLQANQNILSQMLQSVILNPKRQSGADMPSLRIIDRISDAGIAVNEDICGSSGNAAWVLDGATGLSDSRLLVGDSDARWLVEQYDRALAETNQDLPLQEIFETVAARVAGRFELDKQRDPRQSYEMPSAGIAYIRTSGAGVEIARLGDCKVLIESGGRITAFVQSELDRFDGAVLAKMRQIHQSGIQSLGDVRRLLMEDLRNNRGMMNRTNGYWVLTPGRESIERLQINRMPAEGEIRGLVMSDGFYRLVDTFGVMSDQELVSTALSEGLAPLLHRLRSLEKQDPDCVGHARFKISDDATALLFEIS